LLFAKGHCLFDNAEVKNSDNATKIFCCIVFGAFIPLIAWFLYAHGVRFVMLQYRAQSFPKTEGHVLSVQIVSHRGSKGGISYHPAFLYTYEVNGQNYEGRRYRYDPCPADYVSVNQIVTAHPAGSAIEVYYNPDDPDDSVLSPLVITWDVSILFFFTPALLFFVFLFLKSIWDLDWPWRVKPVAGGVKIITEMMTTRARLPRYQPSWLALGTICISSIIAGIAIDTSHTASPISAALFALLLIFAGSSLVYLWQFFRITSGIQDLVIDEGARTVELPLTYKRRERQPLPFSSIKSVFVEQVAHKTRGGVSYTYAPTLLLQDGSSQRLTDLSQNRAELFVAWLGEKLGLPASKIYFDK
jgi:Protein of unknown function (DUF3592)